MKTRFFMVSEPWIRSSFFKFRCSVCNKNRGNQIPPTTIFPTIFFLKPIPTITDIHADQETSHPYVKNLSLQIYQQPINFPRVCSSKTKNTTKFLSFQWGNCKNFAFKHIPTRSHAPPEATASQPRASVIIHALSRAPEVEDDVSRHVVFISEVQQ